MNRSLSAVAAILVILATYPTVTTAQSVVGPPIAEPRPHAVEAPHGHVRMDPYYWMRFPDDPEVIDYLNRENDFTQAVMGHTEPLQERLFDEIRSRIAETDMSVPWRLGEYYYYQRFEEGLDHAIHARRHGSLDAPEEILLDENERAEGKTFYSASWQISPDHRILAFAEDTLGRNITTIRFKDLSTGELLPDVISGAAWNMTWSEDNRTLFFATRHPVTLRQHRVYRHTLGDDPAAAVLVYEEEDDTFTTGVFKTRSNDYIVIGSYHTVWNEYRYLPAHTPTAGLRLFLPRERGHEHSINELGGYFYIRTNLDARNFRLMRTPVERPEPENWREVISHRNDVFLQGFVLFNDHIAVSERKDGLMQLRIRDRNGSGDHYIPFEEEAFVVFPAQNPEANSTTVRFSYQSMTTPSSIFDYDMVSRERVLLKQTEVLGGYDPSEYRTERSYATARDGARVPVSIVYRADQRLDGPQPLLLYGYGSYGASTDPTFSSIRLSLLDRGFIYAIAHIRGGQEFGRDWYEQGKMLNKRNTFYDFIDVAEYLIESGYTAPSHLYALGGSAGGLLMGAVINERPELFHGIIAAVPFVDVVTTMLDDSIPLTTFEYDEWGNPNDPRYYEYMLSYSPYDNIREQVYPHMLVTSGLHDSQVQYWEPTKWVARMRAMETGPNRLLLHTNMEAGHGGAAGRYQRWREIAFEYAFLLDLAGLADATTEPRTDTSPSQ
jgi:oligopeptidase B